MTVIVIVYLAVASATVTNGVVRRWSVQDVAVTALLWPLVWLVMVPALRLLYQYYVIDAGRPITT